jgi:hypothetical protein
MPELPNKKTSEESASRIEKERQVFLKFTGRPAEKGRLADPAKEKRPPEQPPSR